MDSSSVPTGSEKTLFSSFLSILQSQTADDENPIMFTDIDKEHDLLDGDSPANDHPSLLRPSDSVMQTMLKYLKTSLYGASRCVDDDENDDDDEVEALIDSGANCHVLSYKAALKLLRDATESYLKVIGVNGSTSSADIQGSLIVDLVGSSGQKYQLDLGTAHGMKDCPVNLLSLGLLLDVGAILHFEQGNCWIKPPNSPQSEGEAERIPLQRVGGLFQIPLSKVVKPTEMIMNKTNLDANGESAAGVFQCDSEDSSTDRISCSLYGQSFLSGDLDLWHKRMRHVSKHQLKKMHTLGLVDGFNLKGNTNADCGCDTCTQAKIKRSRNERQRAYAERCTFIGQHVSSDIKSLPYESFEGYKYTVCFVDHYSRLGICYMMRTKDETTEKFKLFNNELKFYGYRVHHLHSDRGSEYFSQEGELLADRDRSLSALDQYCAAQSPKIKHTVTPVEAKEKIAEAWFKDHFDAADAMLFEARLSPAFWADAVLYSQFLYNRMPNLHTGPSTPFQMLTGDRARWDKIRVFGADAFMLIPNDDLAKVPGIVKGKKVIFVGFTLNCNGYRVFDPETRCYSTVNNIVFYESFRHRIDALRHHDKRRELMKKGETQPVQLDDFDYENAKGVRNLYLDPDPISPQPLVPKAQAGGRTSLEAGPAAGDDNDNSPSAGEENDFEGRHVHGPLSPRTLDAARARELMNSAELLRPLRLLPVGKEATWTKDDADFMEHAMSHDLPVAFIPNPKRKGTPSFRRYLKYSPATSLRQALELGASMDDIRWDYRRAFMKFPKHESDLPGHIYGAIQTADEFGHTHILDDIGHYVSPSDHTDHILASAFRSAGLERAKFVFNDSLKAAYDPTRLPDLIANRQAALVFAEQQFAKVLNAKVDVNIDFSLAAEPVRWEDTLPDVCSESEKWREAMDDEIVSMTKFGVYKRLPRSAAGNRQILGCRWVYKRKTNKNGEVVRYRARLVAQGFRQREYDSFDPNSTFSPVVHKDTLRLFLSVSAAENLMIYQADVKAAFLQAPLEETIYLRAPPGYGAVDESTGEPLIWELSKAVYGLKQAGACFWQAVHSHLLENGFTSTLGDPCLLRKEMPGGGVILVATYVDDLTFAISNPDDHAYFMSMLRSRFVIDEGEGAPVEWLLGMAIDQDLEKGTVRMNMETAITKLAMGLLSKEELVKASDVQYPMLATSMLPKLQSREVSEREFDYLSVVGSLMHLANCVRCDVAFAVGCLARHALNPGKAHVKACKRVVMYLYNTRTLGITYSRQTIAAERNVPTIHEAAKHPLDDGNNKLQTFADSDYAGDETRRSTYGTVTMLNGGPVAWTSTLGKTVATSTCEAEVNAAVAAVKNAIHLKRLLMDLKLMGETPLTIMEDNSACIAQANSGLRHVRNAKHYEVKLRFLQQRVVDNEVEFEYCPTNHQLADFFTKPLDVTKFLGFRESLLS